MYIKCIRNLNNIRTYDSNFRTNVYALQCNLDRYILCIVSLCIPDPTTCIRTKSQYLYVSVHTGWLICIFLKRVRT